MDRAQCGQVSQDYLLVATRHFFVGDVELPCHMCSAHTLQLLNGSALCSACAVEKHPFKARLVHLDFFRSVAAHSVFEEDSE